MVKIIFILSFFLSLTTFSQKVSYTFTLNEKQLKLPNKYFKNFGNQLFVDSVGDFVFWNNMGTLEGIYKFNLDTIYKVIKTGYLTPNYMKLDMNKNLISSMEYEIFSFRNNKKNKLANPSATKAFDLDRNGILWYDNNSMDGNYYGLTRNSDNKSFTSSNSGILNGTIKLINCDRNGNVWILLSSGLSKFDGLNWTNYTSSNSNFPSITPSNFICDSVGNLWFGSADGLTKFDGVNWTNYNTSNSSIISNKIGTLVLDFDYKSIWVGTEDGISKFDGKNWQSFNSTNSNLPIKLYNLSIAPDKQGNIWLSNNGELSVLCKNFNNLLYNQTLIKTPVCPGQGFKLSAPQGAKNYLWSSGQKSSTIKITSPGDYNVLMYDSLGCPYMSNTITISSSDFQMIKPTICMVTNNNNLNKVIWDQVSSQNIKTYRIYKQNSLNSQYQLYNQQDAKELSEFVDLNSKPYSQLDRYRISYVDSCGNESQLSNTHTTMLLSSNVGINGTVNLSWNAYEGFDYPNFEIWRSTDGVNFIKIGAVANNSYAYIDNNAPTQAWYQIRITKQDACIATKRGENYVGSNIISKEGKSLYINEQKNESFTVYPNPTKDVITINNAHGNTILITDLQGKEVYNALATSAKTEISLKSIGAKGMYVLHIVDEKGVSIENKKIVLE